MRFYGSIRLPIFKHFSPRIGVISEPVHPFRRYNAHQIDETTLTHGGSAKTFPLVLVPFFLVGVFVIFAVVVGVLQFVFS
jgi:hypothetical protein